MNTTNAERAAKLTKTLRAVAQTTRLYSIEAEFPSGYSKPFSPWSMLQIGTCEGKRRRDAILKALRAAIADGVTDWAELRCVYAGAKWGAEKERAWRDALEIQRAR